MKKIFTFAKREFKSHFDHPAGYVVLTVFLGLAFFLYFRSTLVVSEASLRPLFNTMPWLLLFLVPAVTMRSLAADEKEGISEVLLSQPVTLFQYLAGKFVGALVTLGMCVAATLPALVVLARFGSFDWGLVIAQYAGTVFLLIGMCAVSFFASGLTKNQIIAFLIGIALLFGMVIIGWEATLGSVSPTWSLVMQHLSILWHFENITRGVLDLRDVLYFLGLGAVFFALSYAVFSRSRLAAYSPAARHVSSWVFTTVALTIIWNIAAQYIPLRLDLTSAKLYTVSNATKRIVRELAQPVTLKLYASKNMPTELALVQRDIADTLSGYRSIAKGKIIIETVHPETDEQKREAINAGIPAIQFNVMRQGEFQVKEGFFGLAVSQKDTRAEVIPYISQTADFEYQVTRRIQKVSGEQKKTVGFLSGHDGISESAYTAFRQELADAFDVKDTAPATATSYEASELKAVDVLVIGAQGAELSENEKQFITTYLKNGGKLLALVDGVQIDLRSLTASPPTGNLQQFIADTLGVRINPTVVFDMRAGEPVQFNTGGPLTFVLPYPFWARVGAATDSPIMRDLKSVIYSWGGSLEVADDKLAGAEVSPLLKKTPFASEQKDSFVLQPNREFPVDRATLKEYTVAVLVKNILGGTGRAIVAGSSSMLGDQVGGGKPENLVFALNAVDWLAENEDLISIRSKTASARTLTFATQETQNTVQYGIMAGLPLLAILIGLLRIWMRKQKSEEELRGVGNVRPVDPRRRCRQRRREIFSLLAPF